MYNHWVWVQSRRSKSWKWVGTFSESSFLSLNNDDENYIKNSIVDELNVLEHIFWKEICQ